MGQHRWPSAPQDAERHPEADVAADGQTGAVVMAGRTIGRSAGTYVEQAIPSVSGRHILPTATSLVGVYGISGRLGAPGAHVAYTDANSPAGGKPALRLYCYGGATRALANGPFTLAKIFKAPGGRLGLFGVTPTTVCSSLVPTRA
jgi:hypothetical protein